MLCRASGKSFLWNGIYPTARIAMPYSLHNLLPKDKAYRPRGRPRPHLRAGCGFCRGAETGHRQGCPTTPNNPLGWDDFFGELLISEALRLFVEHPSPRREVTLPLQEAGLKALHTSLCQGSSSGVCPANTFIFAFMLCLLCRPDKRLKCHKTMKQKQQLL